MIARVFIHTPFNILIAVDENFPTISIEDSGYKIFYYPPGKDPNIVSSNDPSIVKLNGKDALLGNIVRIDFHKEEFTRIAHQLPTPDADLDPSFEVINKALNHFLIHLRYLTRAPQIHPIYLPSCRWMINYVNDDGSELPMENGKFRVRGSFRYELKYVGLNLEIWNDVFTIQSDIASQNWVNLLLDGLDEFPEIGPSIVLTFTALEVFIAKILNQLATKEKISPEFWEWINKRPDWTQEPSIEEQYDILLKILTGHTLKEDKKLWDAFQNLKTARNTFVHEGVARISRTSQKPLKDHEVLKLISTANEIPLKIREWLPTDIQWELCKNYNITCEASWPLFKEQEKNKEKTN
jgi:hypothetical protein